jgi:hypothetical protein
VQRAGGRSTEGELAGGGGWKAIGRPIKRGWAAAAQAAARLPDAHGSHEPSARDRGVDRRV